MIIEKAKIALEKLQRTNYKQRTDFGLDDETEQFIKIIANECKSTVVSENKTIRYESDIVRNTVIVSSVIQYNIIWIICMIRNWNKK